MGKSRFPRAVRPRATPWSISWCSASSLLSAFPRIAFRILLPLQTSPGQTSPQVIACLQASPFRSLGERAALRTFLEHSLPTLFKADVCRIPACQPSKDTLSQRLVPGMCSGPHSLTLRAVKRDDHSHQKTVSMDMGRDWIQ